MDLVKIIQEESLKIGIDYISFGSVEKLEEFRLKFKDPLCSPKKLFAQGKIYISASLSFREEWNLTPSNEQGYIARYTTANFYKILSKKLESLAKFCKNIINSSMNNKDFYRVFVNSRINDKLAAYVSGLGYYANNTLIFIDNRGTDFVLGEVFLNCNIEIPEKIINNNFCNNCNICIKSCPTNAISENFTINKSLCIQHLTTQKEIPLNKKIIEIWGKRFFGCTYCIDNCPMNKNNIKQNNNYKNYYGYIGNTFDLYNLFNFSKYDYKIYFKGNQIGLSWIEPVVLARNILFALYNCNREDLIIKYRDNLTKYKWNEDEIIYLKKICDFLNIS